MKKILYSSLLFLIFSCSSKKTELLWTKSIPQIGSQSSPRASDLNGDGVLDLVMGAGKNEYQKSGFGIIAIDGNTGELLWSQESIDQIYGSPTFIDVNKDAIKDIVIGGRSNQLLALNGKDGSFIWKFENTFETDSILKFAKYNFQNSILIPDQNNDGIQEILVQNGGNAKAAPNSSEDRFPGVLMIINPVNGEILYADKTPDGLESYTPPLFFTQNDGTQHIVFGTGGETISGSLYTCSLNDLKNRKLSNAKVLFTENGHGFIAPPVAVDLNKDGYLDIVAASHASTIIAFDGKTMKKIWQESMLDTETSNALAIGHFNDDDVPDLFTFVSKGVWPESKGSVQIMIDGATGKIAYTNNLGCTGFSSPVIYDLDKDGIDEAIISINDFDCERGFTSLSETEDLKNRLIAINFKTGKIQPIDETPRFKNIFTTPWIGDLDKDGYLDIFYCQYFNANPDLLLFFGMQYKRISTSIKYDKPIMWGAYMNSNGDGIYQN